MIGKQKKWSRELTRFGRTNRLSEAQGLWYNSRVWVALQDGLYATKRTDCDLHLPSGTLKIEA